MATKPRTNNTKPKPRASREAFFVRIDAGDGSAAFFDATEHVGKIMPFKKPQATCAMRVSDGVVGFSLLHLTKKTATTVSTKPVELPRGPLARLERRGLQYAALADDEIVVEITTRVETPRASKPAEPAVGGGALADLFAAPAAEPVVSGGLGDLFAPPAVEPVVAGGGLGDLFAAPDAAPAVARPVRREEETLKVDEYRLKLKRDSNNVVTLDDEHETALELPRGAVRISMYLRSPAVPRVLAIGFIGHLGKPGNHETVARMAGMVLNSLSHLTEFKILSSIETVSLGASPARATIVRPKTSEDRAAFEVKAYLFDAQHNPLASGSVLVEVDLEHANPTSGRLLCNYTPDAALGEAFEAFRPQFDAGVSNSLITALGTEQISDITYEIVLGSVEPGTVERIREAGQMIGGIDCTPAQYRYHQ